MWWNEFRKKKTRGTMMKGKRENRMSSKRRRKWVSRSVNSRNVEWRERSEQQ